jgi:hypothetical protein
MPEQLAWTVMQGTGFADVHRNSLGGDKATEEALYQRLAGHEATFVNLFGGEPGKAAKGFESSAEQVLFLSNDPAVQGYLAPSAGNLVDRLSKLPADDARAVADELYVSVLTRVPNEEEIQDVANYLSDRAAERPLALQELVWAMMTSAEFRFNH